MNSPRKIAIVDDHTMVRKGLTSFINLFPNYEVLYDAANGNDLIRQLRPELVPDIVLLDIDMPEMDGFATALWLKENYPDIRILTLSTMDAESAIIRMIRNGSRGYLLKDAEPEELKKAFEEVLNQGYYYNDLVSRTIVQSATSKMDLRNEVVTVDRLSERELSFLRLACSEKTYLQIAAEMFVGERTVDGYRDALFKKLGIGSRVGLVIYAIKNRIVRV